MNDIDRLLETLLKDRRLTESSHFSGRIYTDQPILQTGRQLENWQREHADTNGPDPSREAREELRRQQRTDARNERRQRHHARRDEPRGGQDLGRTEGRIGPTPPWLLELDNYHDRDAGRGDRQPIPERYHQMRALETDGGRRAYSAALSLRSHRLFFEQARFMEDFEDDYAHMAEFDHYFPTYAVMDIAQLRSYFTWRARVRRSAVGPAPASYAFLYVYELLCGIGTQPGRQGYDSLMDFWHAFSPYAQKQGVNFDAYLRRWTHDYAIYHDIPVAPETTSLSEAVGTLLEAEGALLARQGRARRVPTAQATPSQAPDAAKLLDALAIASRYRLERSRFVKDRREDAQAIVATIFEALVEHCARRRKTDFVEGLFGQAEALPYTMYPSAVFYDPHPPDGLVVRRGTAESYRCTKGVWVRTLAFRREETSRELGNILRATDKRMREAYGYGHPIKLRTSPPKYVQRIIDEAIDGHLAQQRSREARRISIDTGKLQSIRTAAAATRESLLVDEEREEPSSVFKVPDTNIYTIICSDTVNITNNNFFLEDSLDKKSNISTIYHDRDPVKGADRGKGADLTDVERAVISALLRGDVATARTTIKDAGVPGSVIVDSINDRLFDAIGDAAVEMDGDTPRIVSDYEYEVRELIDT